ncbi:hypothetical protein BANRA_02121 [Escherichia coli]|nr:hypothetical protein BANRA_02121 [Escherichia coli]
MSPESAGISFRAGKMVLSIHISSSESCLCPDEDSNMQNSQSSSSVIFRCRASLSHTTAGSSCASINAGSPSKTWRCLHTVPEGVPVRRRICMSVHRVSHNLSCCFSAYPSCFGISAAIMRSRASSNACVSGPDSGLSPHQWGNDFAINTPHHMPPFVAE